MYTSDSCKVPERIRI